MFYTEQLFVVLWMFREKTECLEIIIIFLVRNGV